MAPRTPGCSQSSNRRRSTTGPRSALASSHLGDAAKAGLPASIGREPSTPWGLTRPRCRIRWFQMNYPRRFSQAVRSSRGSVLDHSAGIVGERRSRRLQPGPMNVRAPRTEELRASCQDGTPGVRVRGRAVRDELAARPAARHPPSGHRLDPLPDDTAAAHTAALKSCVLSPRSGKPRSSGRVTEVAELRTLRSCWLSLTAFALTLGSLVVLLIGPHTWRATR